MGLNTFSRQLPLFSLPISPNHLTCSSLPVPATQRLIISDRECSIPRPSIAVRGTAEALCSSSGSGHSPAAKHFLVHFHIKMKSMATRVRKLRVTQNWLPLRVITRKLRVTLRVITSNQYISITPQKCFKTRIKQSFNVSIMMYIGWNKRDGEAKALNNGQNEAKRVT